MTNQEKVPHRHWWQGWFTDWSLCGPDRRNALTASVWTAVFCLLLALSAVVIDSPDSGEFQKRPLWQWLIIVAPILLGLMVIPLWYRFLNNAEELLKKIYAQAAATGFVVFLLAFLLLGFFGKVFGLEDGTGASTLAFCFTVFSFCFSLQYRLRKYNG